MLWYTKGQKCTNTDYGLRQALHIQHCLVDGRGQQEAEWGLPRNPACGHRQRRRPGKLRTHRGNQRTGKQFSTLEVCHFPWRISGYWRITANSATGSSTNTNDKWAPQWTDRGRDRPVRQVAADQVHLPRLHHLDRRLLPPPQHGLLQVGVGYSTVLWCWLSGNLPEQILLQRNSIDTIPDFSTTLPTHYREGAQVSFTWRRIFRHHYSTFSRGGGGGATFASCQCEVLCWTFIQPLDDIGRANSSVKCEFKLCNANPFWGKKEGNKGNFGIIIMWMG